MPAGERRLQLLELCPKRVGHRQHVAALLHDGDAAHDLAGAIEIGDSAAEVVAGLQVADVLQMHGLTVAVAAEHEELELLQAAGIERPAQLIFAVRDLDRAAARLLEGALHSGQDLLE